MTIEKFKSFPDCGHYTDEEAVNIIRTLENLSVLLFDFAYPKDGTFIDNQFVITNKQEDNLKLAA